MVQEQADAGEQDHSVPFLQSKNRGYNLYHAWKASCTASLNGQEPITAKAEALGRSPKRVNAVLWRVLQSHKSSFLLNCFLDFLLAGWRIVPAWSMRVFLRELATVKSKGTSKYAWAWLVFLIFSLVIRTIATAMNYLTWNGRLHTRIRSQMNSLVFEKLLLVSPRIWFPVSPNMLKWGRPSYAKVDHMPTPVLPERSSLQSQSRPIPLIYSLPTLKAALRMHRQIRSGKLADLSSYY